DVDKSEFREPGHATTGQQRSFSTAIGYTHQAVPGGWQRTVRDHRIGRGRSKGTLVRGQPNAFWRDLEQPGPHFVRRWTLCDRLA
ncbi:hypothetical protein COE65_27110, partial [Bacillus sp. AFS051223]